MADYTELVKKLREHNGWALNETLDAAADAIEELTKDLERSKNYEAFWNEEAEEALRRFQVAVTSKPRWIPVAERLPEKYGTYLVTTKRGSVMVGCYYPKAQNWNIRATAAYWMPLPTPPKEETE